MPRRWECAERRSAAGTALASCWEVSGTGGTPATCPEYPAPCLQAFLLLSRKVLLHQRLTTLLLRCWPSDAGTWVGVQCAFADRLKCR